MFENDDLVRARRRVQSMRHDQRGPLAHQSLHRVPNLRFHFHVEVRCWLVQNQERRVFEERASKRDALRLPRAQPRAALADDGIVTLGQSANEFVGARALRRANHLFHRRVRAREPDVIGDRFVEQVGMLRHPRDLCAPRVRRPLAQRRAVDGDLAARWLDKA